MDGAEDDEYVMNHCRVYCPQHMSCSDDLLRGSVQELDLGSDDDEEEEEEAAPARLKGKRSKQQERPSKIIPTGSDASDSDEDEDEDGPITMKNMEARSRAMDAKAAREAELDAEEMRRAEMASDDDLAEDDMDEDEEEGAEEPFVLPTAEEREEEKKLGGPQLHVVQRRMRECVRVLGNFRKRAAPDRCVERSQENIWLLIHASLGRGLNMSLNSSPTLLATMATMTSSRRSCSSSSLYLK